MNIIEDFLPINPYSRPGAKLEAELGIVIHYPGVAGQTAKQVLAYWAGLAKQQKANDARNVWASAHYVVDLNGDVYRDIPDEEKAYHCGAAHADDYTTKIRKDFPTYCTNLTSPNRILLGIEMCHPDSDGKPSPDTMDATLELVYSLCKKYDIDPDTRVYRHFDITDKHCPLFFVENPDEWSAFIKSIKEA